MRYIIQKSETIAGGWVCTDTENKVVMTWQEGAFTSSQKITFIEDMSRATALNVATILREMGDWLAANHKDKVGDIDTSTAQPAWVGIVKALKEIRVKKGLTQQDVATALGCTKQNYQRFEGGRICPSLHTLSQVCDVLGVKLEIKGDIANWGKK